MAFTNSQVQSLKDSHAGMFDTWGGEQTWAQDALCVLRASNDSDAPALAERYHVTLMYREEFEEWTQEVLALLSPLIAA